MTYLCLGASLALAAFLVTDIVASVIALIVWRAARGDLEGVSARSRANGLFLLRVFPAAGALIIVGGIFLPAFCKFEPRETGEMVGASLVAIAIVSACLILAGVRRGWQASRATRRVVRDWLVDARPLALPSMPIRAYAIRAHFPVVSLVGILRPRLFVSERVLRGCTTEELAVMVRHECGHLISRDNWKRLVLRLCPNPLPLPWGGRELERHWQEACEEAADDYAARASAPSALALANALLRVARMAPPLPPNVALTSLYSGDSIERRVKRLVDSGPTAGSRATWIVAARALAVAPAILAVAVLLDPALLHSVHHLIEVVVETLP